MAKGWARQHSGELADALATSGSSYMSAKRFLLKK